MPLLSKEEKIVLLSVMGKPQLLGEKEEAYLAPV